MSGRNVCIIYILLALAVGAALIAGAPVSMAQGSGMLAARIAPGAWLPLIYGPPPGPPTATPTATASPTATATLTPTVTPTSTPQVVRFVGTTNQALGMEFDVNESLTAVTRFKIEYSLTCPGVTQTGWSQHSKPSGWPIVDGQFTITWSAWGQQDVYVGNIDPSFSTSTGDWLKWLISYVPYPQAVCSNVGTWSATRQ